jgi:hypothetical protein
METIWGLAFLYLLGSLLVLALTLSKVALGWLTEQLLGIGYHWFNCQKIGFFRSRITGHLSDKPDSYSVIALVIGFEMLLSWINVPVCIWQLFTQLVSTAAELMKRAPEDLNKYRYPLRENPSLSPEEVWAHLVAVAVAGGKLTIRSETLVQELHEISDRGIKINKLQALECLAELRCMRTGIIEESKEMLLGMNRSSAP